MKVMRSVIRSCAFVASCACACGSWAQGKAAASQTADFVRGSKAIATASLKDPDSAKFRNTFVSNSAPLGESGAVVVSLCGEMNAKNSYGGYVGFKRFYASALSRVTFEEGEDLAIFPRMWLDFCSRKVSDVQ